MSTHNPHLVDLPASETVVAGQFVKYVSGGLDACDSAGEKADGIAFGNAGAGETCPVQIGGKVTVKVGATPVLDGARLTTDANGLAITAESGDYVRCKAIAAGAAGAFVEALWTDDVGDGT